MLEELLTAAVAPHDILKHPYYRAWTMGTLTRADLQSYAAQYRHQVDALPALLRSALEQAGDEGAREAIARNLAEEEGQPSHRELWLRFAEGIGADRNEVLATQASESTREAAEALRESAAAGEVEALATLWAYEAQTARVAAEKRSGLVARYGVQSERALSFFSLHEELDVHHAADLLSALQRACARTERGEERAVAAAVTSARAQWRFLDGVEEQRQ